MSRLSEIFLLLLSLTLIQTMTAQRADPASAPIKMQMPEENIFESKTLWGVGGYGGLLSGIGLSARFHPMGRICVQLTGGAIKLSELMYDFGLEAQFDFDTRGRSRFYGYIGGGYYYKEGENALKEKENTLKGPLRLGLGIAYEWGISEKLVFNLNGAFTYFTNGDILPLPQVGFYYYFN